MRGAALILPLAIGLPGWSGAEPPLPYEILETKVICREPGKYPGPGSESYDGGRTWSAVHSAGIWGFPPHALQLKNGWVLVSYGYRRPPFGERACLSRDDGRTWDVDHPVILAGAPGPDLGYPSSVQLDDGSILTVYYQADHLNEPTSFRSTHWRLKSLD